MPEPLTHDEMNRILAELDIWDALPLRCTVCSHRHVSVHIHDTERVECPNCHYMMLVAGSHDGR